MTPLPQTGRAAVEVVQQRVVKAGGISHNTFLGRMMSSLPRVMTPLPLSGRAAMSEVQQEVGEVGELSHNTFL